MSFLDPIFSPILKLDPLWAVILISFIVSLIITIIYKYTTNQTLMKQLRDQMKESQKKMKESRDNPERMMAMQKEAMQANMKYMMHSMRSTLITFIPIILIFGWMNAHFAFEPIYPNQQFTIMLNFAQGSLGEVALSAPEEITIHDEATKKITNDQVTYTISSTQEGEHLLEFTYNSQIFTKDVKISTTQDYAPAVKRIKDSNLKTITINNKKLIVLPVRFKDWFGWLGTYIIFSILFSISMRKLFKLH